ncbi:PEP-CTERM sorting domain-containing protein [Schlegelella sp. S2-27]|uniref:PEP-CTERM sorting domain-containing protein n=1 Tax=Caldimonas mangrovi TaxID=2944811 RepID=A0ABT0YL15_9BURK|nr:PEP-CTERM sorting domain-containing protein [Caldimonas mangrovi]MCM5678826.1 PEP-CTERM sorting domain-containing protein [Caldimonas mangrovi]
MLKRLLSLLAFLLAGVPIASHATTDCSSGSFAAAVDCGVLTGHWTVAVLPTSTISATASVNSAGSAGAIPQPVTGTIRVARVVDQDCGPGCQRSEDLPEAVDVSLTGIMTVGAYVLAYAPPPAGEENIYVHGYYTGAGDLDFEDFSLVHAGNGQVNSPFDYQEVTDTVSLAPGDYTFTLGIEGLARLDGQGAGNLSTFTSSLYIQAAIEDPNFEILCTPIPEPETYALMLAGLGAIILRRRGKMNRPGFRGGRSV